MRVFFGTVFRTAPVQEAGELVSIDWETKRILRKIPVFPENPRLDHDPNPRGSSRGCRGLAIFGEKLLAADYHTIRILDHDLDETDRLSHGCMVNLHEIHLEDHSLWVSSTAIDAALKYSLPDGRVLENYWPRSMDFFVEALNFEPLNVDREADNRELFLTEDHLQDPSHLHLNAITSWNGHILALLNRYGVIANLTDPAILVRSPNLIGAHNLTMLSTNCVAVSATKRKRILIYELPSGELIRDLPLLKYRAVRSKWLRTSPGFFANYGMNRLRTILRLKPRYISPPIFVRGLFHHESTLFIGISPATLLQIDMATGRLLDHYSYSSNANVCVHGLVVLP